MDAGTFQTVSQLALFAIATALYAHKLPKRDGFAVRAACAIAALIALSAAAIALGYSLYPPLTDDLSFVNATVMFCLVIAVMTGGVMLLWEAPVWTALFCSSSAYLLSSIIVGLDRVLHLSGIVRVEFTEGAVPPGDVLSLWGCAAAVILAAHASIMRRLRRDGLLGIKNPLMVFAVILAILVSTFFDLSIKDIAVYDVPMRYPLVLSVVYVAVCAFILLAEFEVLYSKSLETSVAAMERAVEEQQRQFELSRTTIEAINARVHDMRHHILRMIARDAVPDKETLVEVAHEISVYDSAVKTGNAALDVVLTEKKLVCSQRGITFTCIADGSSLDFVSASDLYVLFGGLLDDAISASSELQDESLRSISLDVRERMGMAAVNLQYYGRLPRVPDSRVEEVVERYEGTLATSAESGVARVDILIPRSQNPAFA